MQPKKRPNPRPGAAPTRLHKGQGPRRPVGVQALGPVRYEQLRRALHLLNATAEAR
ncbi:hypothetical protein [Archangium lansingense]|uniref:Uncharacterized protein n=1 Tax=Archangium lansingense TaxID=2995310 RepID=A0ABT4AH94_9BACT|nr:hypothetical protein [Archangium lansinium]MCY1081045.1 hypothetical protein [Archangium lansinium]